jgi:hypothetical protein
MLYICRTSLPSLLAPSVAGFRAPPKSAKPPGGMKPQPHRALVADITKTALAELVAFRPTHLIFDFIDERFDLICVGDSLVSRSGELETSGYLRQRAFDGARDIPRQSPACDRLWTEAAGQIAALVRATPLGNARLILHAAQWAERRRSKAGRETPIGSVEILAGRPADIAAHNALLERYQAKFTALMPPMERVEAPDLRLAAADHEWGPSPFHYVPDYYAEIWRQLAALGVEARQTA